MTKKKLPWDSKKVSWVAPFYTTGVFYGKTSLTYIIAGNFSILWLFSTIGQDVFHYYYNTIELTDAWSAKFSYF